MTAATPQSGQLHMLAGSWRYSCRQGPDTSYENLPVVALETKAGDCTVHFGHNLHAAPPPQGSKGRRTLYIGFHRPGIEEIFAPGESSNDVLYTSEDAFVANAARPARRSAQRDRQGRAEAQAGSDRPDYLKRACTLTRSAICRAPPCASPSLRTVRARARLANHLLRGPVGSALVLTVDGEDRLGGGGRRQCCR